MLCLTIDRKSDPKILKKNDSYRLVGPHDEKRYDAIHNKLHRNSGRQAGPAAFLSCFIYQLSTPQGIHNCPHSTYCSSTPNVNLKVVPLNDSN